MMQLSFAVLALLGARLLMGQDATVTGTVTDSAKALIPGVAIKLVNVDTNIDRRVQTNHEGSFTITALQPGKYELSAEMQGFRSYRKTGLVLEIGQTVRDDIELTLGAVTESVSVTAEVAHLNTENGTVTGDVIVQAEINDLPLDGRDFTDLAFLVPGVLPTAQGGQGSFAAINGARGDQTNFYVDGFSNRNPRGAAAQVRPNMSAMQEFRMEVSGYSAEIGKMAGGVLNMVLRSGTNQFHGDIFEFERNNIIDARGFFDTRKLPLHRHQYGATLAGPVWFPKLYNGHNRTFFMFSWESYKNNVTTSSISHVPSLLERGGDFSQSFNLTATTLKVADPLNANAQFPGNQIPLSRLDPIAAKLMAYYPLPNRADRRNNYIATAADSDRWDSFIAKVDHRFNSSNTMSYRYQVRFNNSSAPYAGSPLGGFGNQTDDDRSLNGIDYVHMFSPTLLMEAHSGFSRNSNHENSIWGGINVPQQLGLKGPSENPELTGFPLFNVTDYAPIGSAAAQPVQFAVTDIQAGVKFTWVKSKHVMKWGWDLSRVRFNQPYFNNNRGTFNFTGAWTTAPLPDFFLGMMNTTTRQVGWNRNYLRATSMGGFFNDDFKVLPNLTLNLGVRYELDLTPTDKNNKLTNFVPELGKVVLAFDDTSVAALIAQAKLTDRVTYADAVGLPRTLVNADYNNIAPRAGFAYTPFRNRKTVIRGGYGIFYSGLLLNPYRNQLQNTFPYAQTETYTRNATRPDLVTLQNPFPQDFVALGGTTSSSGVDVNMPTSYLQSYNLGVQRDLGDGIVLEVGFVGSKGTHLGRLKDINLPRRTEAAYLAGIGVVNLRPFPFFNGAINQFTFNSNSIYNAGQISIRKRGRGGMFYRLNYSYSKSIDEASQLNGNSDGGLTAAAQDINNRRADRARSDWDRGHVVTASFSYMLPVGRGKRFLPQVRGVPQGILGGWQFSGTTSFASGAPLTPVTAGITLNSGESQKPNRVGSGTPIAVPGQRRGTDYPWFNPADFSAVPGCVSVAVGCPADKNGFKPFVYGNSGRNIIDGPGLNYMNMSMMKNFIAGERKYFQFRLESFNALNHPNFQLPENQFNVTGAGLITAVAANARGGPRTFQAGLKFVF
ncbi:MAG: TonB-dependent receptor [Candidatus Solibacter usitatus]|nr:TonB-dependent receptor [Candidatus Solibacter usitatus]